MWANYDRLWSFADLGQGIAERQERLHPDGVHGPNHIHKARREGRMIQSWNRPLPKYRGNKDYQGTPPLILAGCQAICKNSSGYGKFCLRR